MTDRPMLKFKADTEQGFTLVELLIGMALALVILTSLSSTFILQQKTYDVQQQIAEMNQNARAAMDIISREIMMTGYGIVKNSSGNYYNLSWIDWESDFAFTTKPFVIQAGEGDAPESGGSDIIYVAGCMDGTVATLDNSVSATATSIEVSPVDANKSVSQLFDTDDEKFICIDGIENAVVTAVSGSTLTTDTDPPNGSGLVTDHRSGASVCVVKVITYSIVRDDDGSYTLKRNENLGAGRQPLAENIVELGISQSGDSIEINPLTAQTDKPDPNYSENNGHRRRSFQTNLTPPNLTFQE